MLQLRSIEGQRFHRQCVIDDKWAWWRRLDVVLLKAWVLGLPVLILQLAETFLHLGISSGLYFQVEDLRAVESMVV